MSQSLKTFAWFTTNSVIQVDHVDKRICVEVHIREHGFDVTERYNGECLGSFSKLPDAIHFARRVVSGRK